MHSLDYDTDRPPRMILKVDIAKAYDMVELKVVLAILHLMNFPAMWINWIRVYLSTANFTLVINGHVSSWFPSGRGLRQGDPLSPYLFLLVSQNMLALLNHALHRNWIPGFDDRLSRNFNDLIFANNLIIVTRASRAVAKACKLCMNI